MKAIIKYFLSFTRDIFFTRFLPVFFLFSCKKVIQVDLNNASPQIVIQGEVTNAEGPYQVSITKTVNFSDDNNFPMVTGALVAISDNMGLMDSLTETSPGIYITHSGWKGQPGNSYTLRVTASGTTYAATSTMPEPVALDSVGFQEETRGNEKDIISAVPYFQDPLGISNYYQFTETINGTPLNKIFVFEDRLSDGKYIHQPVQDDSSHLSTGDVLILNMFCVDENSFKYFRELKQGLSNSPFRSVTPANPDTNLSGGALGYFSAHTVESKQCVVHL